MLYMFERSSSSLRAFMKNLMIVIAMVYFFTVQIHGSIQEEIGTS